MNWGNIRGTFYTYGGLFQIRTQWFELVPVFGKFELSPFEIKIRTHAFELITVPCCEAPLRLCVDVLRQNPFNCDKNVDNFGSVPLPARQGLALPGPGAPFGPFFWICNFFVKFLIFEYCKREYLTLGSLFAIFEPWIWRRLGPVPACYYFLLFFFFFSFNQNWIVVINQRLKKRFFIHHVPPARATDKKTLTKIGNKKNWFFGASIFFNFFRGNQWYSVRFCPD